MAVITEALEKTSTYRIEPPTDRPDGRSVFMDSRERVLGFNDLLPWMKGLVADLSPEESETGYATTVIVDGTVADGFVWQLGMIYPARQDKTKLVHQESGKVESFSFMTEKIRHVQQVTVNSFNKIQGWSARYNVQGSLVGYEKLDTEGCETVWADIQRVLDYPATRQKEESARARKKDYAATLEEDARKQKLPTREIEKHYEILRRMGFAGLSTLQDPRNSSAEPTLKLFS